MKTTNTFMNIRLKHLFQMCIIVAGFICISEPALAAGSFDQYGKKITDFLENDVLTVIQAVMVSSTVFYLLGLAFVDFYVHRGEGVKFSRYIMLITGISIILMASQLIAAVSSVIKA